MDTSDHNMTDAENDERDNELTLTRQNVRFLDLVSSAEETEEVD